MLNLLMTVTGSDKTVQSSYPQLIMPPGSGGANTQKKLLKTEKIMIASKLNLHG